MYHYNAFISYNHNPRDIRIARLLQHQLENFRIPEEIAESAGVKKIERIFLDTGELEVAGDLNKVILDALENTDYLIVICSPESRNSIWVRREIEYFLKTHSIDDVLTVISEGEPQDVLPEVLLYENQPAGTDRSEDTQSDEEDVEAADSPDDSPELVRTIREPLSCDYRLPPKIARRTELPRLAAAMIGCRYDDLVQRQRHYRQRRITAAVSVSALILLSAVAYLIWSNHQINTNLEASLREQSNSLAMQSEQALSSGDRIGALKYALEALPSGEDKRPVVNRAVLALSRAMNLYKGSNTKLQNALRRYPSYGSTHLRLDSVEKDGRVFMAELYTSGRCVLWDAQSGEELMHDYTAEFSVEGLRVQNLAFNSDGTLILITEDSVRVIDCAGEKEIKNIPLDGEYFKFYDINELRPRCDDLVLSDNELWIPVGKTAGGVNYDDYTVNINSANIQEMAIRLGRESQGTADLVEYCKKYTEGIKYSLVRIDLNKGKVSAKASIPDRPMKMKLSPDGKMLACCFSDYYLSIMKKNPEEGNRVDIYDSRNLSKAGSTGEHFITDFAFDDSGHLFLCGFEKTPEDHDAATFEIMNYSDTGMSTSISSTADRSLEIRCVDISSLSEVWSRKYSINAGGVPWLALTPEESVLGSAVICTTGNNMQITGTDGRDIAGLYTEAPVRIYSCDESSLISVLGDGALCGWHYDEEKGFFSIVGHNVIMGPVLTYKEAGDYVFAVSYENEGNSFKEILTQYQSKDTDSKLKGYEYDEDSYAGREEMKFISSGSSGDSFVEVRTETPEEEGTQDITAEILVRDSESGKISLQHDTVISSLRKNAAEGDDKYTAFGYSGIDDDGEKAYFLDNNGYFKLDLLSVDLKTGEEKITPLTIRAKDYDTAYCAYDIIQPSELYTAYEGTAGEFSYAGGEIDYAAMEVSFDTEAGANEFRLAVLETDPETGETDVHRIGEPMAEVDSALYTIVRLNAVSERLILFRDKCFTSYDYSGRKVWSGEAVNYDPIGFVCTDEGHVVALERTGNDAVLHMYSADSGEETAAVSLGAVSLRSHEKMSAERLPGGEIMITAGDDAFILDGDTWALRTVINDTFIGFNPQSGQFMVGNADDRKTGHVPYRTLEEMIAEAEKSL